MTAAGVLLGIGMGAEYGALSYFCSRYFGLKHFGTINAVLYAAVILAQGLTPAVMDLSYGRTGSYDQAALAIIATLGIGMALLFLLPAIGPDGRARLRGAGDGPSGTPAGDLIPAAR